MTENESAPDKEFAAMKTVYEALQPLDENSRQRVVDYVASRLEISIKKSTVPAVVGADTEADGGDLGRDELSPSESEYETFAELFDAAGPRSNADKALIAAYWAQVCEGSDSFDGFTINKALKDLGHGIPNITNAIDALKNQKPALALQLKKSGKSQQARKIYKVTAAGEKYVEAMTGG